MSGELPQGWAEIEAGNVLNLVNGFAFKPSDWGKSGLPIIRIQNLNNPKASFNYCDRVLPEKIRVRKGDLLFAWSGTPGTSFGAHIWNGGDAWLNQHIFRVEFNSKLFDKAFLRHAINQNLNQYISEAHGGAGLAHITKGMFEVSMLTVAPLAEQRRIVAKLEKLLAQVNACQQRLEKIPAILKRFRQSVLTAACSGRLTEKWRNEHLSACDADDILRSVQKRRESLAHTGRERQEIDEIYARDDEEGDSEPLPMGWRFAFLNKLADSFDYGTSSKSQPTGRVPVLRMGNIQGGRIDWSNLVYTSDHDEIAKYALKGKTVLFNRTNSPELVGKTAIYMEERPAIFAGYLIRIKAVPELDPEYLNSCLNTPAAREFCQQVKTDGVSQSNINAQKLGTFEVPFCPPEEQREIVRRINALFAFADRIESRYAAAKKQVNGLTQSILAKAFDGELVPTEAELAEREGRSYESAEQLLERIQSARRDVDTTSKKGKASRRRTPKRRGEPGYAHAVV